GVKAIYLPLLLPVAPLVHPLVFAVETAVVTQLVEDVAEFLRLNTADEAVVQLVVSLDAVTQHVAGNLDRPSRSQCNEGIHGLSEILPARLTLLRGDGPIMKIQALLVCQPLPVFPKRSSFHGTPSPLNVGVYHGKTLPTHRFSPLLHRHHPAIRST